MRVLKSSFFVKQLAKVRPIRGTLSTLRIVDVKNDSMYVLDDANQELSYLREVETEDGRRGIVLKIEESKQTYVAMYKPITRHDSQLQIKSHGIPWKKSNERALSLLLNPSVTNHVVDVEGNIIHICPENHQPKKTQKYRQLAKNRLLDTMTPILDVCYDLSYGQMITFEGCLGSRKTSTLESILNGFGRRQKHVSLYLNTRSYSQAISVASKHSNCLSLSNGSNSELNHTDAGVYMLTLKAIALANQLKKAGLDVMLGIDNFKDILQAEWHMLQMLKDGSKDVQKKLGDMINYKSLKISPISILNQIYASCIDEHYTKKFASKSNHKGSFTSIIITEAASSEGLIPELSTFSNNLKHLNSISKKIQFPLRPCLNHNTRINAGSEERQSCSLLRTRLNAYLTDMKQSELRRRLYKADMTDSPWDYYEMLDSDWWIRGLKEFRPQSQQENEQFLDWIAYNVQAELTSQWLISAKQSFQLLKQYQSSGEGRTESIEKLRQEVLNKARIDNKISPFKKDYIF